MLVGACLGLGITILFSGIQMAGDLISRAGGLTLSDLFDPTFNSDVPLFSRLLVLIGTAIFACIGGHRVVMAGLLDTFAAIPPGGGLAGLFAPHAATAAHAGFLDSLLGAMLTLIAQSFQLGVRVCMPVVVAALLATLILGLIGRTLAATQRHGDRFRTERHVDLCHDAAFAGGGLSRLPGALAPAIETLLEVFKVPLHRNGSGCHEARRPKVPPWPSTTAKNPRTQHRIAANRPAKKATSPRARTWDRRPC